MREKCSNFSLSCLPFLSPLRSAAAYPEAVVEPLAGPAEWVQLTGPRRNIPPLTPVTFRRTEYWSSAVQLPSAADDGSTDSPLIDLHMAQRFSESGKATLVALYADGRVRAVDVIRLSGAEPIKPAQWRCLRSLPLRAAAQMDKPPPVVLRVKEWSATNTGRFD